MSTGWHLTQFMGVCLCYVLCLCVSKIGGIVSAPCWRFFSLSTVDILGPLVVSETSEQLLVFES